MASTTATTELLEPVATVEPLAGASSVAVLPGEKTITEGELMLFPVPA
jgi:hypothetical protein